VGKKKSGKKGSLYMSTQGKKKTCLTTTSPKKEVPSLGKGKKRIFGGGRIHEDVAKGKWKIETPIVFSRRGRKPKRGGARVLGEKRKASLEGGGRGKNGKIKV